MFHQFKILIYKIFLKSCENSLFFNIYKKIFSVLLISYNYFDFEDLKIDKDIYFSKNGLFKGEENFIKKLSQFNFKSVLDIGCNQCSYSECLIKYNRKLKVHGVDPLFLKGTKRVLKLYPQNFFFYNNGITNKNKNLDFYLSMGENKDYGISSLHNYTGRVHYWMINKKLKKKFYTLKKFCSLNKINKVDFVKIDTEGNDYFVLEKNENLLKKLGVKIIQLEMSRYNLHVDKNILNISKILKNFVPFRLNLLSGIPQKIDVNLPDNNFYFYSIYIFIEKNFYKKKFKN